jgi:Protein of unknown function (DUF2970)
VAAVQAEAAMEEPKPVKTGPLHAAKTVFWAFFGVRKRSDHESVTITPAQIIVAGLIGAALFVLSIIMVVRLVLG